MGCSTQKEKLSKQGLISVNIKPVKGNTLSFAISQSDTVATLRVKISEEGAISDHQQLVFDGKVLEKLKLLSDYQIKHNSTIHLGAQP